MKQENYSTIAEYAATNCEPTQRLCICQDLQFEYAKYKRQETFYRGLANITKLELAKLNISSAKDIYEVINTPELTMQTQLVNSQERYFNFNNRNRREEVFQKNYSAFKSRHNNKNQRTRKYC